MIGGSNRGSGDGAGVAEIATSCVSQPTSWGGVRTSEGGGNNPLTSQAPQAHARLILAALDLAERRVALPCQRIDPFDEEYRERRRLLEPDGCPSCPLLDLCIAAGAGERYGVWAGVDHGIDGKNRCFPARGVRLPNEPVGPRPEVSATSTRQREGVMK